MSAHNEMTRYAFISHMEDYMKKLLNDPLHADTDSFLKSHEIDGPKAIEILTKRTDPNDENSAIITRTERIKDNGTDENGKRLRDSFTVKYKIPRKDYTKKMRNLYISLFESNIVDGCPINEDGEGGGFVSDGAASSGQYDAVAFGQPIRRKTAYFTEEQINHIKKVLKEEGEGATSTNSVGNYQFDVPMGGKPNKGSNDDFYKEANDHKNIMAKSWKNNGK